MSLERIYQSNVVTVSPDATVLEVAQLMRSCHVGSVIVVAEHRPVGIITDRDIVVKVVAAERNVKTLQAKELMTSPPALININYDPLDVTRIMRDRGVRRLPVVDENCHLLGIVTMDDLLRLLGREIGNLAEAVHTELSKESAAPVGA